MMKFLIAAVLLGAFFAAPGANPSFAQSKSDWRDILIRVSELEGQVEALKRNAKAAGGADLDTSQRALLADMEVRIGQLETEIRKLTGTMEEITYRQTRIEKDIDLFKRDVDLRFQDQAKGGVVAAMTPQTTDQGQPEETTGEKTAVAEIPPVTLPEGSEDQQYDFAFGYLRRGDYPGAEAAFRAFLDAHPDHPLAGNAQYWLGETYYVRKDYPDAAAAFLKAFQAYGEGTKGPDSLLKLGMSLASMNQNEQACSAYEELLSRYPDASETVLTKARSEQERLGCS